MVQELVIKNHVIGQGRPLICVPVMAAGKADIIAQIKSLAERGAQMIEWRVDAFEDVENLNAIREVLAGVSPYLENTIFVYTFRSKKQGGQKTLDAGQIYDIHQIGAESDCVDFVDVEFFEAERPLKEIHTLQKMGAHVIASHHDFSQTPEPDVMGMILEKMKDSGADVVKLAVMPHTPEDVIHLLNVTAEFHSAYPETPVITMSMGRMGCLSRIAGETFGSCVTFGADAVASAPGQLPMEELDRILEAVSCHSAGERCV